MITFGKDEVLPSLLRSRPSGCRATLPGERCVTSQRTAAKETRFYRVQMVPYFQAVLYMSSFLFLGTHNLQMDKK